MNPVPLTARKPGTALAPKAGHVLRAWWAESLHRQRALTLFAAAMLLAMVPALIALGLDDRLLRGVNVWVKPLKFMASLAVFSLSTAWFIGLLPPARRGARAVQAIAWILIVCATAEVAYITLQAALGQASHYSQADALHRLAYQLMGAAAMAMMVTQLMLAREIARHGTPQVTPVWRDAVVLGLVMTFVLGVGAAFPLASAPPPTGAGLPVLGWHLGGGDLRPAHFIGSHAQQAIPLLGALLAWRRPPGARTILVVGALGYTALWAAALLLGLSGANWVVPA